MASYDEYEEKKDQMILVKFKDYLRLKKIAKDDGRTLQGTLKVVLDHWQKTHG